jgi:hypothetical protein
MREQAPESQADTDIDGIFSGLMVTFYFHGLDVA